MKEILNDNIEEKTILCTARLPKDYIHYPPKYPFILSDIAEIMIDLDLKDTYIVKLPNYEGNFEERKELIKQCVDMVENECGSDCAIIIESFISYVEFPRSKYTLTKSIEEEKELIPFKDIMKRERDMLTELGFICINDYIDYAYKEAFIYGNINGKLVRQYIDKFTETR